MEQILELLMKNPETVMPFVKAYIDKYKPVVYALAQELFEVYKDYANNTEIAEVVAKAKKHTFDTYVNAGFTEDQAMAFMINDNIQLMNSMKQSANSLKSFGKSN